MATEYVTSPSAAARRVLAVNDWIVGLGVSQSLGCFHTERELLLLAPTPHPILPTELTDVVRITNYLHVVLIVVFVSRLFIVCPMQYIAWGRL